MLGRRARRVYILPVLCLFLRLDSGTLCGRSVSWWWLKGCEVVSMPVFQQQPRWPRQDGKSVASQGGSRRSFGCATAAERTTRWWWWRGVSDCALRERAVGGGLVNLCEASGCGLARRSHSNPFLFATSATVQSSSTVLHPWKDFLTFHFALAVARPMNRRARAAH